MLIDSMLHDINAGSVTCLQSLRFIDSVRKYYQQRDNKPLWFKTIQKNDFPSVLADWNETWNHGLRPSYYLKTPLTLKYHAMDTMNELQIARSLAELDILTTHGFLAINHDITWGKVEVDSVLRNAYQLPRNRPDSETFYAILDERKPAKVWAEKHNNHKEYQALRNEIVRLTRLKLAGTSWVVPDTTGYLKIEQGDSCSILPDIATKLMQLGEIDSAVAAVLNTTTYNTNWFHVVQALQAKYGLYSDGVIGPNTFGLICGTLDDYLDEHRANLERIRWFNQPETRSDTSI
jgi:murein L,D-transpeptidase YcbB/YkuD